VASADAAITAASYRVAWSADRWHDHRVRNHASELLTDDAALRHAIRNEPLHSDQAWAHGLDVDGLLRRVVASLNRLPSVVVEHAEFDDYGSGYASYVEVSITKRDGSLRQDTGAGWIDVECLGVLLCRLAPVACLLRPSVRSSGPNGAGAYSLPEANRVIAEPDQRWKYECDQIKSLLDHHDVTLIGPDPLTLPLSGAQFVETNLADSALDVFDAWFHWRD
jgi:hypothetical protein